MLDAPMIILIVLVIYNILLTLLILILIAYISRLRRNSVCKRCRTAFDESVPFKRNVDPEKTVEPKLILDDNKNLSPAKTRKKIALPDKEVHLETHHYEEIMDRIKTQQPELYDRVLEPLQRAIRESIKIDNKLWQSDSTDQVQCSDMVSHTYEKIIYNNPEDAYDILLNVPQRIAIYKDLQPCSSKTGQDKINDTTNEAKKFTPTKGSPQKIVYDSEVAPLKSNVEPEITVKRKFNLESKNINKKESPPKTRKKLANAEIPSKIHHYEEIIIDRIKTQQPELYEHQRESINIANKTDRVQCSDMLRPTYEEVIDHNSDNTYDIFVNFPKNHNLKDLQSTSSETSQNKTNEPCPQKIAYDSEVVPLKPNVEPEITIGRKFSLENASAPKTRKKLAQMPDHLKKCRKKKNEMEVSLEEHRYEKIKDSEKIRQSELMYKAVIDQLQTTLRESTSTDDLKQTEVQYFDMLSHTYEKVIYNNPEKAHYKTPKRSISFRSSFGMKDHLKYLQPSSSHTSEDDINETTYLEAKQFIPTEDCPQKLRSLCNLQDRIEEKATPWLPPSRIRTQSDSNVSSKGFFDLFLKRKK